MDNQQINMNLGSKPRSQSKVPIGKLLPILLPQVNSEAATELQKIYGGLQKNEITRSNFIKQARNIVGIQLLEEALVKAGYQIRPSGPQVQTDSSLSSEENCSPASTEVERQSLLQKLHVDVMSSSSTTTINQEKELSQAPTQEVNKKQGQHLGLAKTSFPTSRSEISNNETHVYSGLSVSGVPTTMAGIQGRPMREDLFQRGTELKGATQSADVLRPKSIDKIKKMQSESLSHSTNTSALPKNLAPLQWSISAEQKSDAFSLLLGAATVGKGAKVGKGKAPSETFKCGFSEKQGAGSKVKACLKRSLGQDKPIEAFIAPSPPPSKRPKVSGSVSVQGFELPDVIDLSGIDLKAEEEQLFTGQKGSQASKALGRVEQEKEELMLILQKAPLHKKLAQIMSKCGIKRIGKDVDRCLSLCVEERMQGLIQSMIKLSKQRVDFEKPGHQTVVSSDIKHQISVINRELEGDWRKKQPEVKELKKKANGEKGVMVANAAARAALGGDDLTSKWKLLLKSDRGIGSPSRPQHSNDASNISSQISVKTVADGRELQQKGIEVRSRKETVVMPQMQVFRSLSMKDVMAILEHEPQMSKSTFIYNLYEKMYDA